ncbi:hypothetical protein [Bombiscardovia coagulans]|uniref:Uncharacterized protein n=1 Tax=Bombiscardovia coagulans TaxID=686666 RepID=A0A261EVH5_9BIFI|nr:hypothetical protein [Bombiscardovia coagulans]OZG50874.1 hypothetical protein BOCO_0060 [Bombiscardovia coagulans]
MIREVDRYGSLTRTSPFYCDGYQINQDKHQPACREEEQIPPTWGLTHSVTWSLAFLLCEGAINKSYYIPKV